MEVDQNLWASATLRMHISHIQLLNGATQGKQRMSRRMQQQMGAASSAAGPNLSGPGGIETINALAKLREKGMNLPGQQDTGLGGVAQKPTHNLIEELLGWKPPPPSQNPSPHSHGHSTHGGVSPSRLQSRSASPSPANIKASRLSVATAPALSSRASATGHTLDTIHSDGGAAPPEHLQPSSTTTSPKPPTKSSTGQVSDQVPASPRANAAAPHKLPLVPAGAAADKDKGVNGIVLGAGPLSPASPPSRGSGGGAGPAPRRVYAGEGKPSSPGSGPGGEPSGNGVLVSPTRDSDRSPERMSAEARRLHQRTMSNSMQRERSSGGGDRVSGSSVSGRGSSGGGAAASAATEKLAASASKQSLPSPLAPTSPAGPPSRGSNMFKDVEHEPRPARKGVSIGGEGLRGSPGPASPSSPGDRLGRDKAATVGGGMPEMVARAPAPALAEQLEQLKKTPPG